MESNGTYRILFLTLYNFLPLANILWTHYTLAKILRHLRHACKISTHVLFLTHTEILWTHTTHTKIWFMQPRTHATHAPTLPKPSTLFSKLSFNYPLP